MRIFFVCLLISIVLVACNAAESNEPLVLVATPDAPDAGFETYEHPTRVFSLRIPPDWIPAELPHPSGVRVQFTTLEAGERVARVNVVVVNTGVPLTTEAFIDTVNAYQPPSDVAVIPWRPVAERAAMRDGSVRLAGIRDYPNLGPRALNVFLQGDGSYFSALEVDVTDASPDLLAMLQVITNTFVVNTQAPLNVGQVAPVGSTQASGVITFENYFHWNDANGGFNITGQALNTADIALEGIRLTAYLYDQNDNLLAERADVLPYDVLTARGAAPFRIRFDTGRPSTAVRYELHAAARRASQLEANFLGRDQFLVGEDEAFYNNDGDLTIQGLVQNNAGGLAQDVEVIVAVYDENGHIVGTEGSFIPQEQLLPGEAVPFEITLFDLGGNAVRYTLIAQGRAP
ncbi:MAG: FxLYD domain-containing protein [Anaerolineales bacterium]